MQQRLGIAAALLGDPPALMLDEPFNGMDPPRCGTPRPPSAWPSACCGLRRLPVSPWAGLGVLAAWAAAALLAGALVFRLRDA